MGQPLQQTWIASPGGWVPPDDGSSPGWDWVPMVDGYGIVLHPERMPLYVQLDVPASVARKTGTRPHVARRRVRCFSRPLDVTRLEPAHGSLRPDDDHELG